MSSWKGKTRGGVLGYKIFVFTLKYLGVPFAYFLLYFVVTYFIFTSPKAIRSIFNYFRKTLGYGLFRSIINIYRNYYIFGQTILDKIVMMAGFEHQFTFTFEGEEFLRQMKNGGLLVSGHIGNWESAGNLLNRLEKKINILIFDAEHKQIKGYLSDVYQRRNVNFIVIREDYSHLNVIREALSRGEIIAMHGDRYMEGNKVMLFDFLGHPAAFPVGPINLAARFGVPVSFVFAVKENRYHYHFYATPLYCFEFSKSLKKREVIFREAVGKYVKAFEKIVHRYPLQWFNYYDFWKTSDLATKPMYSGVKKRKFLFVSANRFAIPYPVYPLGISYLFSYLSRRMPEFDFRIFDFNLGNEEHFKAFLKEYNPDFTGLSLRNVDDVNSMNKEWFVHDYKAIADIIKSTGKTRLIVGGSAFSIYPKELFEYIGAEFGITGEGEESLYRLLLCLEGNTGYKDIDGLVYREGGQVMVNDRKNFINSLDLSFDRNLVHFYWDKSGMMNIQTKRGCPYHCIYCTYPLIEGSKVRTLSAEKIIETLSDLVFNKKISYIFFTDSVFNISNNFNIDLAEKMIEARLNLKWGAYFSPHNLDESLLRLLKEAGLTHIEFGTE